jgi:hypothetical protein
MTTPTPLSFELHLPPPHFCFSAFHLTVKILRQLIYDEKRFNTTHGFKVFILVTCLYCFGPVEEEYIIEGAHVERC